MPPDALLLISTGCTHCPVVFEALSSLLKEGRLGRLEVVNIAVQTDTAEALGVRSVPWMRIGEYDLEGLHSKKELLEWVGMAELPEGYGVYLSKLLESGDLEWVLDLIRQYPEKLPNLVELLASPDTSMTVRIGIGAVFEEYSGSELLAGAFRPLTGLIHSKDPHTRVDACYYLALTGHTAAVPLIEPLLQDENPEVRETARESLDMLGQA